MFMVFFGCLTQITSHSKVTQDRPMTNDHPAARQGAYNDKSAPLTSKRLLRPKTTTEAPQSTGTTKVPQTKSPEHAADKAPKALRFFPQRALTLQQGSKLLRRVWGEPFSLLFSSQVRRAEFSLLFFPSFQEGRILLAFFFLGEKGMAGINVPFLCYRLQKDASSLSWQPFGF